MPAGHPFALLLRVRSSPGARGDDLRCGGEVAHIEGEREMRALQRVSLSMPPQATHPIRRIAEGFTERLDLALAVRTCEGSNPGKRCRLQLLRRIVLGDAQRCQRQALSGRHSQLRMVTRSSHIRALIAHAGLSPAAPADGVVKAGLCPPNNRSSIPFPSA